MGSRWKWKSRSSGAEKKTKQKARDGTKRDSYSFEKYNSNNAELDEMSSNFTRMVLAATPENTYGRPKWESFDILDILQAHLEDYSMVDESLFPGLPLLKDDYPEIHHILASTGPELYSNSEHLPPLWRPCIEALRDAVDTQGRKNQNGANSSDDNDSITGGSKHKSNSKKQRRPRPNGLGELVGVNRPLTITFLRAICAQFVDCLAFEALRTWKKEKYAFRGIRVGPNNGERIRVELREDVCWRARKQIPSSQPSRDFPAKKIGLGPLFAVLIKTPEEFIDLRLSALADLKPLLTILQDRRREAAYTTTDDISSRDQVYSSYIVSVSSSVLGCVSINTLTASGYYLAAIENGDPPPKGEKLLYRRGQNLDLCDPCGRAEFTKVMLGLLSKVCEKKEARSEEELSPEDNAMSRTAQGPKWENSWGRVRKKSRLTVPILFEPLKMSLELCSIGILKTIASIR